MFFSTVLTMNILSVFVHLAATVPLSFGILVDFSGNLTVTALSCSGSSSLLERTVASPSYSVSSSLLEHTVTAPSCAGPSSLTSTAAQAATLSLEPIISLRSTSGPPDGPDPLLMCQLGECGQSCPAGFSAVQLDGKGDVGINTGCSDGARRLYCCPSNDLPTCTWRGQAPFCGAAGGSRCDRSEVEVISSTSGTGRPCWTGHKVLCCMKTGSNSAVGHCQWQGSAPFCSPLFHQASCSAMQQALTKSNYGAGGEKRCLLGQKSFCCNLPPPYTGCDWYYHSGNWWGGIPLQCTGTCPAGKSVVATDPSWCWSGYGVFCCDNPSISSDPVVEDFKRQISTFANNPTCRVGQQEYSRRDTELGHITCNLSHCQMNKFEKRASLSNADFALLLRRLSEIARGEGQTQQRHLMASQFNMLYGDRYGLYVADFTAFINGWPNVDPPSLCEALLCMGNSTDFLSEYYGNRSLLCINPCPTFSRGPSTTGLNETFMLARNLENSEINSVQGPGGEPSWALMMTAIMEGLMTLEYEQLIRTNTGDILEIVWLLPSGNGPGGIDPAYQDPDPSDAQTNPDLYVVFHFHTDHIATIAGTQQPGIYSIVAFHGQYYNSGTLRVHGYNEDGRQRRVEIIKCGDDPNPIFFYPGGVTYHEVADDPPWVQIMAEFGEYLVTQELLTVATFTGTRQGQLELTRPDTCGRRYFLWNGYTKSMKFGPNGAPLPRSM